MTWDHFDGWLQLGVRWLHVVAGVVWIGTSFYFVWLNNKIRHAPDLPEGSEAELWAVHGGGFYRVLKYARLSKLPETLHWFKWEAYTTWLSGFSLLVLLFYLKADVLLIDSAKADVTPLAATVIGVGVLVVGWFVYDWICKSALLDDPPFFVALSIVLISAVIFGLTQVFTARAAYVHTGALIGTLMAGNVFFIIIPAQKELVAAIDAGREPDSRLGTHAALRSLHNNYLTLPVLFIMISSHFPFTFGDDQGWAVLAGLTLVGALIRHWFNLRGQGHRNMWALPVAALGMLTLAYVTIPDTGLPSVDPATVSMDDGVAIITTRCAPCHSSTPSQPGFTAPPKDIIFDTPAEMVTNASMIKAQAISTRNMPLGNLTGITDDERAILSVWLDQYTDG